MPTPLSRVALRELIEQNLTDPLNQQNTAARVREVFASLVESAPNVVDDLGGAVSPGGGTAGPLYATTGQHTDGPMHQKAVTDALAVAGGAPQWQPGPQKAGALVYDQGLVYRVKQTIANSTSAPAGNPANYEPVGAAAAQDALTPASATKPPSVNAVVAGLLQKVDKASMLHQTTLAAAQQFLLPNRSLDPNTLYLLMGAWNGGDPGQAVIIPATTAGGFAAIGYIRANNKPVAVVADVAAGVYVELPVDTRALGDVPTQKALDVIAAYKANGGPVVETDELYYGQEFTDDFTEPGDEFLYVCKIRRPVTTGDPTVWKWGRYQEAGV